MAPRRLELQFADVAALEREFETNLRAGGCFVPAAVGFEPNGECVLELVHPATGARLELSARVVWVATHGDRPGVGVTLLGFSSELRDAVARFLEDQRPPGDAVESVPADSGEGGEGVDEHPSGPEADRHREPHATSRHQRLRGLSAAEQMKVARGGDASDRIVLERIYGKAVWIALLSNPRVTVPEVARLARMGNLPIPQLDQIVANGAWLQSPQVRRALLSNPRLSQELALRVLRLLPTHELKLVPSQTSYSSMVRDAARRLLGR